MLSDLGAIRSCKYLYLSAITEPEDNHLRIVLLEAAAGDPVSEEEFAIESNEAIRSALAGSRTIAHLQGCRTFELQWKRYIGYSVVNESYSNGEPETSVGHGRLIVEYESSNYLTYLSKASFASPTYPGPFRHWAIYCLNHTIDVASQDDPIIKELRDV